MNEPRIDRWARSRLITTSRRQAIMASVLGGLVRLLAGQGAEARKKHKRKKKRKIKRNAFGCVNVGGFCKNDGQCCSGICQGKKDKKKCQDHDTGGCDGEQDVCTGVVVPCITTAGESGGCVRTTGNAGYCEISGACFPCTRDPDCVAVCGPLAACIVCELECGPNGTACVGPSETSCTLPE